jgi:hypothetical protein
MWDHGKKIQTGDNYLNTSLFVVRRMGDYSRKDMSHRLKEIGFAAVCEFRIHSFHSVVMYYYFELEKRFRHLAFLSIGGSNVLF